MISTHLARSLVIPQAKALVIANVHTNTPNNKASEIYKEYSPFSDKERLLQIKKKLNIRHCNIRHNVSKTINIDELIKCPLCKECKRVLLFLLNEPSVSKFKDTSMLDNTLRQDHESETMVKYNDYGINFKQDSFYDSSVTFSGVKFSGVRKPFQPPPKLSCNENSPVLNTNSNKVNHRVILIPENQSALEFATADEHLANDCSEDSTKSESKLIEFQKCQTNDFDQFDEPDNQMLPHLPSDHDEEDWFEKMQKSHYGLNINNEHIVPYCQNDLMMYDKNILQNQNDKVYQGNKIDEQANLIDTTQNPMLQKTDSKLDENTARKIYGLIMTPKKSEVTFPHFQKHNESAEYTKQLKIKRTNDADNTEIVKTNERDIMLDD